MLTSTETSKVWAAFFFAQSKIGGVEKGGENAHTKSTYMRLQDLLAAIRPACAEARLAISQEMRREEIDLVATRLTHVDSGEWIETSCPVIVDASARNHMHALGSAYTYGSRYNLAGLFCVPAADDDDGNAVHESKPQAPRRTNPPTPKRVESLDPILAAIREMHSIDVLDAGKVKYAGNAVIIAEIDRRIAKLKEADANDVRF